MPGYTHLLKAQPVLLAHYFLAFEEMFSRDATRFADGKKRIDVSPLGAAALAGTGLPIDRRKTAKILKFAEVSKNSMDTVADRDFIAEFIFSCAVTMMHLSRFCEDLVLWSSEEFGFAEISDAYTTGSSIMPQKKNPDIAELVRGKTARVYGDLVAIMTLLKGLPMTYNRDLQEDKEPLFDTVDTTKNCLMIFTQMLANTKFNVEKMRVAAEEGFCAATDIAEYLVKKGVAFRQAHEIVGRIVAYCLKNEKQLSELSLAEYRKFYKGFSSEIYNVIKLEKIINTRKHIGGTATSAVAERIKEIERKTK
jgi:argininosuccinate lyase